MLFRSGSGKAAFTMPYFGFGYYTSYEAYLQLHNPTYPQFNTYFVNDQAYVIGGAIPIGPGMYAGINLKRINRWGGTTKDIGLSTIANSTNFQALGDQFGDKGVGYGVDLGLSAELEMPILRPSLAMTLQDAGNTTFTKTAGTDAPPHIPQNLSAGAGFGIDLPGIDFTTGVELRHLLESEVQFGKKLHLGAELSLPIIDLRAGLNQGYFTYGVGMNFFFFHLDAVSYTEELGVYPGQTSDSRYAVSLTLDLSFDANFKFTDNNGKRRKLKQRR